MYSQNSLIWWRWYCCYILYLCITAYLIILLRFSLSLFSLVILPAFLCVTFPKPYLFSFLPWFPCFFAVWIIFPFVFFIPFNILNGKKKRKKERKTHKKATVKMDKEATLKNIESFCCFFFTCSYVLCVILCFFFALLTNFFCYHYFYFFYYVSFTFMIFFLHSKKKGKTRRRE